MILPHGSSVTQWWKTKPLDGTVTLLTSSSLASASPALLINCCCAAYAKYAVARTFLRPICVSGTFQGAQVTVAHYPVTNKVDCCEKFYLHLPRVVEIVGAISPFRLVMCGTQFLLLLLLQ